MPTAPVSVDVPSTMRFPFAEILPALETVTPVEPYPPPMVRESAAPVVVTRVGMVAVPVTDNVPAMVEFPSTVNVVVLAVSVMNLSEERLVAEKTVAPPKLAEGLGAMMVAGMW